MKNKFKGTICLTVAVLIWGSAFIAQSVGMELIGPFTFQLFRSSLAVCFLIPAAFLLDRKNGGFQTSMLKWRQSKLWKGGILCGLALFVAASLQQVALQYTDAGKAGFITAMYIVLVPVLGLFLKKKPPKAALVSVVLSMVGLYLLSAMGVSSINIGDIMLSICALAFAVQILLVDKYSAYVDGIYLNCVQSLVVVVLSIPFAFITETIHLGNVLSSWLPLVYAGILSMGVAYTLQIEGQKHLEPTIASVIMSMESVIAVLCGWLILNERMTGYEIAGCVLVFAAVMIAQIPEKKKA